MPFVPAFSERRVAMGASLLRFVRFSRVLLLMAGPRGRIRRKDGEHGKGEETGQRAQAPVHSMVPLRESSHKPRDHTTRTAQPMREVAHRRLSNCRVMATLREKRGGEWNPKGNGRLMEPGAPWRGGAPSMVSHH